MKKIMITTIMVVLVAGFATAYPNQHRGDANRHGYTMDNKSAQGKRFTQVRELKELKGELVIKENSFPAIKTSKGKETIITLGVDTVESLKLKNGSKITVRGIEVPYEMNTTDETVLRVNQIDYDNKTYAVHGGGHGSGRNDGRHGGGHGHGGRYDDSRNDGRKNHYNPSVG